jgi:hypothetical protein
MAIPVHSSSCGGNEAQESRLSGFSTSLLFQAYIIVGTSSSAQPSLKAGVVVLKAEMPKTVGGIHPLPS